MGCKQKGLATIIVISAIMLGCIVVGVVSDLYLGPDNPVEELMEDEVEELLEEEFGIPGGCIDVEFSNG